MTGVGNVIMTVNSAYFIDEQRQGPYVLWYHEHRFEP